MDFTKKICTVCGKEYIPVREEQTYCSKKCRKKAEYHRKKHRLSGASEDVPETPEIATTEVPESTTEAPFSDIPEASENDTPVQGDFESIIQDEPDENEPDCGIDSFYFGMDEPDIDKSENIKDIPESDLHTIPDNKSMLEKRIEWLEGYVEHLRKLCSDCNDKVFDIESKIDDIETSQDSQNEESSEFIDAEIERKLNLLLTIHNIQFASKIDLTKVENKTESLSMKINFIATDNEKLFEKVRNLEQKNDELKKDFEKMSKTIKDLKSKNNQQNTALPKGVSVLDSIFKIK